MSPFHAAEATFPACDECGRHPEVFRCTGGTVRLWHPCAGHQVGWVSASEHAAADTWRATYAGEGVA